MKYQKILLKSLIPAIAAIFSGCGKESTDATVDTGTGSAYLLQSAPAEVPGLNEALTTARPGEFFHFTGRVGGLADPITEGYAAFVVADEVIVFCDEMGDKGHCPTPWDACCENPEKVAQSRALVQFNDANGLPRVDDLTKAVGLAPNDTVIILGELSPDSLPGSPIILAQGIAIRK